MNEWWIDIRASNHAAEAEAKGPAFERMERLSAELGIDPGFQSHLRETLMQSPRSMSQSFGNVSSAATAQPGSQFPRLRIPIARTTGAFSTLLLIGVVLAGMFVALNQRPTSEPFAAGSLNSAVIGTPATGACVPSQAADMSGQPFALIMPDLSDEFRGAALSGSRIFLQKVSVPVGSAQPAPLGADSSTTGLEVDVVLHGFYLATFDVDVFTSGNKYAQVANTRVSAHTPVELSHGDAVIVPYGKSPNITNASSVTSLDFLRILTVTSDNLGAPSSNVIDIASSSLPNRLNDLSGEHSVQFRVYLTQFAGSGADTTSRHLCDNQNVIRALAVQDPTAKNAKADKIVVGLAWAPFG